MDPLIGHPKQLMKNTVLTSKEMREFTMDKKISGAFLIGRMAIIRLKGLGEPKVRNDVFYEDNSYP